MGEQEDMMIDTLVGVLKRPLRLINLSGMTMLWAKSYFSAQKATDPEKARVVETPVDDRIAIKGEGAYPYIVAYLFILYMAMHVMARMPRRDFKMLCQGYREMILESEKIFLTYPTKMRDRARLKHPLVLVMQDIDGPTNCFPSLHVALVALIYQASKDDRSTNSTAIAAMRQVTVDVCRSTLETKQHSVMDVIGGLEMSSRTFEKFLGGEADWLVEDAIPELTPEEIRQIKELLASEEDMKKLGEAMLAMFKTWPGTAS